MARPTKPDPSEHLRAENARLVAEVDRLRAELHCVKAERIDVLEQLESARDTIDGLHGDFAEERNELIARITESRRDDG
jgi:uncharacterized coiled-coil DUF342 family protein